MKHKYIFYCTTIEGLMYSEVYDLTIEELEFVCDKLNSYEDVKEWSYERI